MASLLIVASWQVDIKANFRIASSRTLQDADNNAGNYPPDISHIKPLEKYHLFGIHFLQTLRVIAASLSYQLNAHVHHPPSYKAQSPCATTLPPSAAATSSGVHTPPRPYYSDRAYEPIDIFRTPSRYNYSVTETVTRTPRHPTTGRSRIPRPPDGVRWSSDPGEIAQFMPADLPEGVSYISIQRPPDSNNPVATVGLDRSHVRNMTQEFLNSRVQLLSRQLREAQAAHNRARGLQANQGGERSQSRRLRQILPFLNPNSHLNGGSEWVDPNIGLFQNLHDQLSRLPARIEPIPPVTPPNPITQIFGGPSPAAQASESDSAASARPQTANTAESPSVSSVLAQLGTVDFDGIEEGDEAGEDENGSAAGAGSS
ncbi:hypothetical protein Dda_7816 [Drechslerella dactyloides]|uniref:Uncharacterized protein n=1 Tax=Drechslerella dactyloides TaxID=74499 RepID=A0AAD6IR86_DREDA|nr:hypothetical protein Dda_7816 [Drechslerella dactyloides]